MIEWICWTSRLNVWSVPGPLATVMMFVPMTPTSGGAVAVITAPLLGRRRATSRAGVIERLCVNVTSAFVSVTATSV